MSARPASPLRTPLCRRLGLEAAVISSGMGAVAAAGLVAAVSEAGGLGVLAGLDLPVDALERAIADVRRGTDRPFGVNLWLHTELRPPVDPADIDEGTVAAVNAARNRFGPELGLDEVPPGCGRAPPPICSPGPSRSSSNSGRRCSRSGWAIRVRSWWADARRGDRRDGIADGRGLAASLLLGAQAVLLGTRFVATQESGAATFWKDRLVAGHGEDTVVTDKLTGYFTRALANELTARHDGPVLPSLLQAGRRRTCTPPATRRTSRCTPASRSS